MHFQEFESGIVKIMDSQEYTLSGAELDAVSCLKSDINMKAEINSVSNGDVSLVKWARKKCRLSLVVAKKYMPLEFILPTTNICERLFSIAGNSLKDRRKGILPIAFERQMFLEANSYLRE